jgi:hypothetical protein
MEERKSAFVFCPESVQGLKDRLTAALEPVKGEDKTMDFCGKWYRVHYIYSIPSLCFNPAEEVYLVLGDSVPKISTHPVPEQFNSVFYFENAQARGVSLWHPALLSRIWKSFKSRLLANDQAALLDVAEIIGRTKCGFRESQRPIPLLTEHDLDEVRKVHSEANSLSMRSEWLSVLHTPQLQIADGTVFIQVWAKPGINPFDLHTRSDKLAFWKITTTLSGDVVENNKLLASIPGLSCKTRGIQHCYEDLVIQQLGSGNFKKNLNYKLFDNAFLHLAKHEFTGEEEGYTPGDEKFRKFFVMKLKQFQNITPKSIKFLINNCYVNSLDLSDAHALVHSKIRSPGQLPTDGGCDACAKCVTAVLQEESQLTELNLSGLEMDGFEGCILNKNITNLSVNGCRALTSLEFLDLLPNLEHLSMRGRFHSSTVSPLEQLTRLRHLSIQNTIFSSHINFNKLSQLKSVNIINSCDDMLEARFCEIVRSLPNLECIAFSAEKMTTLTALGELKHLRSVEIDRYKNDADLGMLTSVTRLTFTNGSVSQTIFDGIGHLTQLEVLEILPYLWSSPNLGQLFSKLRKLKVFNAQGDYDGSFLEAVSPDMEDLHTSAKQFNPTISRLTNLKNLVLSISRPTGNPFYEILAKLTQLESLELSPMTNDGLGQLTTLVNLKELNIRQQKEFDSNGAIHFKHFTKLRRVSFYQTPISDLGLVHLTKLEQLEYLSVKGTNVSKEAIQFLENHRAYLEVSHDGYFF